MKFKSFNFSLLPQQQTKMFGSGTAWFYHKKYRWFRIGRVVVETPVVIIVE